MSSINSRIEYLVKTYCNGNNSEFASKIGINEANVRSYLNGTEPKFNVIEKIAKNFEINFDWLIFGEGEVEKPKMQKMKHNKSVSKSVTKKVSNQKYKKGNTNQDKQSLFVRPNYVSEVEPFEADDLISVPLIDIEAAAGEGAFNPDYIEELGKLSVPANMLSRRDAMYYAIRTRGSSMAPTIFDRDILIIRFLERGEWQSLRDEYIYVVVSKEGNTYVKRIKDRLRNLGILILMSDNLDKSSYPNFTLDHDELSNFFFVEMKISPYLQNINSSYYDRLKNLEDKVDILINKHKM